MIEAQVLGMHQDPSLGHYLGEWLAHTRGRVRVTTYEGYESLIRCYALPALGEVALSELSPLLIQRLYASLLVPERRLSAGTVLNLHLVLTQALGQAVRWGILERNPAKGAQPPRPVRPELVVDRGDGGPLNPDTLSSRWRLFLHHSGLPHVRFHDLRHAHATLMLLQGVHPKVVSERLGHASVGITLDLYSHVLPSMQQDAVRAIDELFGR